jgi:hypothetical protein
LVQIPNHIAVAAWWPRIASWFIDDFAAPGALLGLFKILSNNEHKPGKKFSIVTSASYATWSCAFRGGNIERPSRRATGMMYKNVAI